MANILQNFFWVNQRLKLRRQDFCRIFYFLLEQVWKFVLKRDIGNIHSILMVG